jgi:hypothetical protein
MPPPAPFPLAIRGASFSPVGGTSSRLAVRVSHRRVNERPTVLTVDSLRNPLARLEAA